MDKIYTVITMVYYGPDDGGQPTNVVSYRDERSAQEEALNRWRRRVEKSDYSYYTYEDGEEIDLREMLSDPDADFDTLYGYAQRQATFYQVVVESTLIG